MLTRLETAVEEKMREGMNREKAARAARIELGSVAAVKDRVRDVGWESVLDSLRQATATLAASPSGSFNNDKFVFSPPVMLPQGASFAVVVSFDAACSAPNWPTSDFYRFGELWVDDDGAGVPALPVVYEQLADDVEPGAIVLVDDGLLRLVVSHVHGHTVTARVDPYPNETFKGTIKTIGGVIDPRTRTMFAEAEFANRDGRLRPGLFARVEAKLD